MRRWLKIAVPVGIAAVLVAVMAIGFGSASIDAARGGNGGEVEVGFVDFGDDSIHEIATVSANGKQVTVAGDITCTAGNHLTIKVNVVELIVDGGIAKGKGSFACTGAPQEWSVVTRTKGGDSFEPTSAESVPVKAYAWAYTQEPANSDTESESLTLIPE